MSLFYYIPIYFTLVNEKLTSLDSVAWFRHTQDKVTKTIQISLRSCIIS